MTTAGSHPPTFTDTSRCDMVGCDASIVAEVAGGFTCRDGHTWHRCLDRTAAGKPFARFPFRSRPWNAEQRVVAKASFRFGVPTRSLTLQERLALRDLEARGAIRCEDGNWFATEVIS